MADIDLLPARGIPFRVQVAATGIATAGTKTIAELAAVGMHPVCIVDSTGAVGGVTVEQLAQRGIRAACLVDDQGNSGAPIQNAVELRKRGIRPLVKLTIAGLSGTTTMLQLAQRGLDYAALVNESGTVT